MIRSETMLFYLEPDCINDGFGVFSKEESHHILNVLRLADGIQVTATDGNGRLFDGTIVRRSKKEASIQIQTVTAVPKPDRGISVFVGMLKNRQRMEWMVEKLTEFWVGRIVFLNTSRSERATVRIDRLSGVAISAMKQSKGAWLPKLEVMAMSEMVSEIGEMDFLIAHEKQVNDNLFKMDGFRQQTGILIGPEGGFTDNEIEFALDALNARPVFLGDMRLRTETAAVVMASLVRFNS